ncbi:gamma-glutamyl:cysteine ligase [Salmonella enterica subsp. enterica serovar Newport str. WA_14900]|nr:gamma-glutamyl:cysteine ligase [Salmonella enterica subsp. enterica serovar Newport str. WA_14900]
MALNDFHVSEPYTLGIELEMQVINPPGYDLSQDSSTLIDAVKPQLTAGEIKHDITESMLEMATGVCRDIDQAAAQLSAMQHVIYRRRRNTISAFAAAVRTLFKNGSVRRSVIMSAINARWKISAT